MTSPNTIPDIAAALIIEGTQSATFTYDNAGNIVAVTKSDGIRWDLTRGPDGNLTAGTVTGGFFTGCDDGFVLNPDGASASRPPAPKFDGTGDYQDQGAPAFNLTYDEAGRLVSLTRI